MYKSSIPGGGGVIVEGVPSKAVGLKVLGPNSPTTGEPSVGKIRSARGERLWLGFSECEWRIGF